jgi:hypothetical protein
VNTEHRSRTYLAPIRVDRQEIAVQKTRPRPSAAAADITLNAAFHTAGFLASTGTASPSRGAIQESVHGLSGSGDLPRRILLQTGLVGVLPQHNEPSLSASLDRQPLHSGADPTGQSATADDATAPTHRRRAA